MEDIDGIIVPILRQIGCTFKEDSIGQFGPDQLVQAISHALHAINSDYKFPIKLPPGSAGRFRICSDLCHAMKELGFQGELGYQQILYPNEKEMRRILSWLVDRLPKADEGSDALLGAGAAGGAGTFDTTLTRAVMPRLREWASVQWDPFLNSGLLVRPGRGLRSWPLSTFQWMPPSAATLGPTAAATAAAGVSSSAAAVSSATVEYFRKYQPLVSQQCPRREQLAPTVFERNAHEIALLQEREKEWESGDVKALRAQRQASVSEFVSKAFRIAGARQGQGTLLGGGALGEVGEAYESNRILRRRRFEQENEPAQAQVVSNGAVVNVTADGEQQALNEEELQRQRDQQLADLQTQLKEMAGEIGRLERLIDQSSSQSRMVENELGSLEERITELEDTYKVKKRTLDLLPDAENNMKQLQAIADSTSERLLKLGEEWEQHRQQLLSRYRRKKQFAEDRRSEARSKLEQMKQMRADMKQMAQDIRDRDEQHRQVLEELNRLPKSINRQVYVRRIMDIVRNLDKQKADIRKILEDVRQLQKEINAITETSQRSFAVADEMVFQEAQRSGKKNPNVTQVYKHLVRMRKGFEELVQNVEATGRVSNESRDISSRIETIEGRNTQMSMDRIKDDLAQVKKENSELMTQLQAAGVAPQ